MTPQEARQYLDSFINYEFHLSNLDRSAFNLDRLRALLVLLGSPQEKLKIIHVAGTKGKGSTCALVASILEQAGFSVGLYTSPHLSDYSERIRILSEPSKRDSLNDAFKGKIQEEDLAGSLQEMYSSIEKIRMDERWGRLTFFEVLTALAFYFFSKQKVDFVVLETGLGGRLDATNVARSLVAVITPLSLEHTKQLGSTIEAIAAEKAAIIKDKNQSVVVAPQFESAREVIQKQCRKMDAKAVWVGEDIQFQSLEASIDHQTFQIKTIHKKYSDLKMKLVGEHQLINAAMSVGVIEELRCHGYSIRDEAIRTGLWHCIWPGRFEVVQRNPLLILDGAHNPASAEALVKTLQKLLGQK